MKREEFGRHARAFKLAVGWLLLLLFAPMVHHVALGTIEPFMRAKVLLELRGSQGRPS